MRIQPTIMGEKIFEWISRFHLLFVFPYSDGMDKISVPSQIFRLLGSDEYLTKLSFSVKWFCSIKKNLTKETSFPMEEYTPAPLHIIKDLDAAKLIADPLRLQIVEVLLSPGRLSVSASVAARDRGDDHLRHGAAALCWR